MDPARILIESLTPRPELENPTPGIRERPGTLSRHQWAVAQGRDLVEPASGKMKVNLNCSYRGSWPGGRPYRVVVGVHPELNRLFAQPERLTKTAATGTVHLFPLSNQFAVISGDELRAHPSPK
jgi:hypothetical protein